MKILNMVVPILMCFKLHEGARHQTKCDIINEVKLFPKVSQDILLQIFDVIQSDVAIQNQEH